MSTLAPPRPRESGRPDREHISRVPYLPGLDGMRALAVVAVMVYHANSGWLPGGFLGVEMFFVISGYLITLLLISERERTYRISLRHFWLRRARRLLPALYVMLALVIAWTAAFKSDALGQLRGDVFAGVFYVSNWYQIFTGLGYTAAGDFAPLRHLWSLAVEEQFYLFWPLVMIVLLGRSGTRRVADVSRWLFVGTVVITVVVGLLYYGGPLGDPAVTPDAYWWIGDRPIAKIDALYLSTLTRLGGLMLGSAFAMVWRPAAILRGPLRTKGRLFDVVAFVSILVLAWMTWAMYLATPSGADPMLFRGGFFLVGLATVAIIAAVTHRGAASNRVLGNPVFVWIGTRSYGLYLYHWPIYQMIRGVAGNTLSIGEFALAMTITCVITEASYRLVERPVRSGALRRWPRRRLVVGTAVAGSFAMVLAAVLVTAPLRQNEIAQALDAGEEFTTNLLDATPRTDTDPSSDADFDATLMSDGEPAPRSSTDRADEQGSTTPGRTSTGSVRGDFETTSPLTATTQASSTTSTVAPPSTTAAPVTQLGVVTALESLPQLLVPPTASGFPLVAVGDSVMLGAAEELQARGFQVDAMVSRQMKAFVPTMQMLHANGTFGSVVVVHLGTNGSFSQATLDEMLATLVDVPVVLLLTAKADRGWVAGNNELLRAVPASHPNVTVVDWEVLAAACVGTCFYSDGIHLTASGQQYYADVIVAVLGL